MQLPLVLRCRMILLYLSKQVEGGKAAFYFCFKQYLIEQPLELGCPSKNHCLSVT